MMSYVELAFGQIELVFKNGMFLILRFEVENDQAFEFVKRHRSGVAGVRMDEDLGGPMRDEWAARAKEKRRSKRG